MPGHVTADPDRACPHLNFYVCAEVNRLTATDDGPVTGYAADITISCAECSVPFEWIGLPSGLSPSQPMVSFDRTELRAPIKPADMPDDRRPAFPDLALSTPPITLEQGLAMVHPEWTPEQVTAVAKRIRDVEEGPR
jgi:hypothetical protein